MRLVSPLVLPSYCKREWLTTGFSRAARGKSHSGETPTTSSPRPSAKQISVAAGRRETIRMDSPATIADGPLKGLFKVGPPSPQDDLSSSSHLLPSWHGRENRDVASSRKEGRQHQPGKIRNDEADNPRGAQERGPHPRRTHRCGREEAQREVRRFDSVVHGGDEARPRGPRRD